MLQTHATKHVCLCVCICLGAHTRGGCTRRYLRIVHVRKTELDSVRARAHQFTRYRLAATMLALLMLLLLLLLLHADYNNRNNK